MNCLVAELRADLLNILHWCKLNKLQFNPRKTKLTLSTPHQWSLVPIPSICIPQYLIQASDDCTYLGVRLKLAPSFLQFYSLMNVLCIHSYVNCCIITWGITYSTLLAPVQVAQNKAIKIINCSLYYTNTKQLLQANNGLTVSDIIKHNLGIWLCKHINNRFPFHSFFTRQH